MKYTHTDSFGMRWRMAGSRPVSALADKIMNDLEIGRTIIPCKFCKTTFDTIEDNHQHEKRCKLNPATFQPSLIVTKPRPKVRCKALIPKVG